MKKIYTWVAGLTVAALAVSGFIPGAQAAVNVTAQPTALVSAPIILPANSSQTGLFSFSLSASSGETLSSVSLELNAANASTTVSGSHIASVAIYQDNGSNTFNPATDNLVGSQTSVNIGSPTVITPVGTTAASGEFYVSLATSASWSSSTPADSITATLPNNAIVTSANSPTTNPVTTSTISAQTSQITSSSVSISTQLSATTVATGTPVYDAAMLSNATANAGGTVTYNVYSGSQCSATPLFTSTQSVSNGVVPVSGAFTPTTPGTYSWQAVYSGDANNNGATSACGGEILTVSQSQANSNLCSNGLIKGRIYHLTGSDNYYVAQDCSLQTLFSGKINFHGRKNGFKGMIEKSSVKGLLWPANTKNSKDNSKDKNGPQPSQPNQVTISSHAATTSSNFGSNNNISAKSNSHASFGGGFSISNLFHFHF